MKRLVLAVTISLAIAGNSIAVAQAPPAAPDRAQVLSAARDVMKQARYASLVTIAADGQPQARVVDPADPDANLTVWIATNPASRKVVQLRRNSRATLLYFDRATESYVSLLGSASLVTDPAEKERHWQSRWAQHYPDGPRAASHMLIRFTPRTLEIVSAPHKLQGDPKTWRPVVLKLSTRPEGAQVPAFEPIAGTFGDRLIDEKHNGRTEFVPAASPPQERFERCR